jgi:hypothetical protein
MAAWVKGAEDNASKYGAVRKSPWHPDEQKRKDGVFSKQAHNSQPLPISVLRRCKAAIGCENVNDIVIAMVTGAFARVMKAKGMALDEYFCFAIPKSYRSVSDPDLCNRVGWFTIYCPSFVQDLAERSKLLTKIMRDAKAGKDADTEVS